MTKNTDHEGAQRRAWARPELSRLNAGDAENQRGAIPDGGGGNQGS